MIFEIKTKLATKLESKENGQEIRTSLGQPTAEYFIDEEKVSKELFEKVFALVEEKK